MLAGVTLLLTWFGALALIRTAHRLGLVDVPNARSSHVQPRPRGGGIAIVAAFALVAAAALPDGGPARATVWPWVAGGTLIALTGLLDDVRGLGQGVRLLAQTVALGLAMVAIGAGLGLGNPSPAVPLAPPSVGPVATALVAAVIVLVMVAGLWWINLFNFMDGIDGLAACQAIFMLLAGIAIRNASTATDAGPAAGAVIDVTVPALAILLAGGVAGFLLVNWSPARIFMGDCGSLFLGFAIFTMALHDVTLGYTNPWSWLILSGSFLVDATVTLSRRFARGENIRKAHRSHAYQRISRRLGNHANATLVYCLVNVVWLLPLAIAARVWPTFGPGLALIALLPLVGAVWWSGAGTPDQ